MKSDREKDDVDRPAIDAELVDPTSGPQQWMTPKPVQVPVTSARTAKGVLKAAQLNTALATEERKAADLELQMQRAQAEAAKLRAETFALIKEIGVRIKRLRREAEELATQIEIELVTRDDRVRTAKANSARERLLAEAEYQIARLESAVRRIEAKMRAASSLQDYRDNRKRLSDAGKLDDDEQRRLVAWAELVAVEAAEENLEKAPVSPYGEFAAYHYVCARLREETHADAIVSTARTVINRHIVKPLEEDDEQRAFYRGRFNKLHVTWRNQREAVRTAEVQAITDDAAKERDRAQEKIAELRLETVQRELEIARLHHGAAEAGGDTIYDREK